MKNFRFESIWILSRQERRARYVEFHPKKNLVVGRNHTGKSSLIKTLFNTLGAKPRGELQNWDPGAISAVSFTVDGELFTVLHHNGNRAIFDATGELVAAATTYREWSEVFATAIGFNLALINKDKEMVAADAPCFFLPFYINQDGSWQSAWDTFGAIKAYRAPLLSILEYFSGVRPHEYYEVSAKKQQVGGALDELQRERKLLARAKDRFAKSVSLEGPKLDPSNFVYEVRELTLAVNHLNVDQEQLREAAVRERELLADLRMQVRLAVDALDLYERDSKFLLGDRTETFMCPTCGAEHDRSFLDLLTYAEDARVLRELVARLRGDEKKLLVRYGKTLSQLRALGEQYAQVSKILEARHGELSFGDVVTSMGAESAFAAFKEEEKKLAREIGSFMEQVHSLTNRMKELTDPKRSRDILVKFRSAYSLARQDLNLPPVDVKKMRLSSRPDLSGSGGPRSILAYYAALWSVCFGESGSYSAPIVIDAPQQQGQDDFNLPKVLHFIANSLPATAQVIVGSEIETSEHFERRIGLNVQYNFLSEDQFDLVANKIEPLVTAMNAKVFNRQPGLFDF